MNREFIREFENMKAPETGEAFDARLLGWIQKFGSGKFRSNPGYPDKKQLFTKNADFEWIEHSGFSEELQNLLTRIRTNTNYKDHYASVNRCSSSVEFNEAGLAAFDVSREVHRLLFLASFWNAMKYWNVNIHLTQTPWSQVLTDMIPEFSIDNPYRFEVAKEKLFSKLNDSHSNYGYSASLNALSHYPGFGGRIINDSLVVNVIFDEALAREDGIVTGDVIYSVNDIPMGQYYRDKFSETISVTNENYLKRSIEKSWLLASEVDSIKIGVLKTDGTTVEKYIQLKELSYPAEKYIRMRPAKTEPRKKIS
jgi:hypothetical protein